MLNVNKGQSGVPVVTEAQLEQLGEGLVAYVKPIRSEDLSRLFPQISDIQPGLQLFALVGANGRPLSVADTRDGAVASAMQNELHTVSLH